MTTQNITLSLPVDILKKIKHIAVERDKSVSGLLTEILKDLVDQDDAYKAARERHLYILSQKINMGTEGNITWSREDLHAR